MVSSFNESNESTNPHEHELNSDNQYFRAAPENFGTYDLSTIETRADDYPPCADYFGRQIHSRESDIFMFGAIT